MNTLDTLARPALPLIVFGVLKGYIRRPLLFMAGTLLTLPGALKAVDRDLPLDFIRSQGFVVHLYRRLQKRVEKERAFEIVRAALLCSGLALMQANFRSVEAVRSFENLVRY